MGTRIVAVVVAALVMSIALLILTHDDATTDDALQESVQPQLSRGVVENLSETSGTASSQHENDNRVSYETITEKERARLPDCSDISFSFPPAPLREITAIEPRGSTNPPEHALASSSADTYVAVDTQNTDQTVPLYAPGDIWLTFIQPRYGVTQDPEDHVIHYALCKDVFGIFDHVKGFSAQMQELVEHYECEHGGVAGDEQCPILLLEPVKAGTVLGSVGRMQGNFNFGTWDLRHRNEFINPERQGIRALHSTCPLDYYPAPLREQLTALLDREDSSCGTVAYDRAGTAQGEWFHGDAGNRMHGDWVNHLFLGYDNRFPEAAVISVGGIISEPLKWMFAPQRSGTRNVGFEHVTDNQVFCYENAGDGKYRDYEKGPAGRILIQLVGPSTLKIEHQQGSCTGAYSFSSPSVYER